MDKITIRGATNAKKGLIDLINYIDKRSDKNVSDMVMVEIGCYVGDSTEIFAVHVDKVHAIDPWENGYDEKDAASYQHPMKKIEKQFDEMAKEHKNITKYKMKSDDALDKFEDGSLDFVYIDGLHTYEGCKNDMINWLPKIKEGGFLCGHDYQPRFKGVIDAVNEFNTPDRTFSDTSWVIQL